VQLVVLRCLRSMHYWNDPQIYPVRSQWKQGKSCSLLLDGENQPLAKNPKIKFKLLYGCEFKTLFVVIIKNPSVSINHVAFIIKILD